MRKRELKSLVDDFGDEIDRLNGQLDTAREHHDADQVYISELQAEVEELKEELQNAVRVLDAHHGIPLRQDNRQKLSQADAEVIRRTYWGIGTTKVKDLAELYDVHPSTISRIVNRKAYNG